MIDFRKDNLEEVFDEELTSGHAGPDGDRAEWTMKYRNISNC